MYVAPVSLPMCYVVIVGLASVAVGWYFYVPFHVVFVHFSFPYCIGMPHLLQPSHVVKNKVCRGVSPWFGMVRLH